MKTFSDVRLQWFAESDPAGTTLATGDPGNRPDPPAGNQGGNGQPPEWLGKSSDEFKDKNMGRFKEPVDLAKSYVELETRLGNSIQIPGTGASQEEKDKFFKRVGRPDSSDGYELSKVKLPEGQNRDEAAEKAFAEEIFKQGYSKKQAKDTWKYLLGMAVDGMNKLKKEQADKMKVAGNKMREDLGSGYDEGMKLMRRVIGRFADKEAKEFLEEGLGNDPRAIRFLISIGKTMSEDTLEGRMASAKPTEAKPEPGLLSYPNSPQMTGDNRHRVIK